MSFASSIMVPCIRRHAVEHGRSEGAPSPVNLIQASKLEVSNMHRAFRDILLTLFALVPLSALAAQPAQSGSVGNAASAVNEGQRFPTPEDAAQALLAAAREGDRTRLAILFGTSNTDLLSSGDEVEDKNNRDAFVAKAQEKMSIEKTGADRASLRIGQADWPFPFPIVKTGEGWRFDAKQGREEIINRRVGRNELSVLGVINGYLEAQAEYASADRDGDGVCEYAQKLGSTPGTFDGLFWETAAGQPPSPLGPLVAEARAAGYRANGTTDISSPYHGYYYRILTGQGSSAPGGKYDYVINGNMIAGFGLVAFPAQYGSSGVMTFIVNHQGDIYQKDLGPQTAKLASEIKEYNPTAGWELVTNQQ